MPELPDVTVYIEALERRVLGRDLRRVRLASPFLLRTVTPPLSAVEGRTVAGLRRLGKRIVFDLGRGDEDRGKAGDALFLVLHLMIAGRLWWRDAPDAPIPGGRRGLAAFDFADGTLILTEAGSRKRAALHLVAGAAALAAHDPGGLEPFDADLAAFAGRLRSANHTLKRALTDPRLISGVGNAYSDEILHAARLSPVAMTRKLTDDEMARLWEATRATLADWCDRLRAALEWDGTAPAWPDEVTAFRPDMAVHGRYGQPCPVCGTKVQRIRYASNETNYCPRCQTGGRLLADRGLSRLLKKDWPRSIEELEERATQQA
jgi:formamidopyrimidine-DNA glycosylase